MRKVIITGVGGFLEGALEKELLNNNYIVYGLSTNINRLSSLHNYENFVPILANYSNYSQLANILRERDFDYCIHTAWDIFSSNGISGSYYDFNLQNRNIEATCELADSVAKIGTKRFVLCGSNFQAMVAKNFNHAVHYYGIAKQAASDYSMAICRRNGIECNVAIINNTYGIGDYSQKSINTFIHKLINNESLKLIEGNNLIDWVYISDIVKGLICVAESDYSFKQYNIGHIKFDSFKEKLVAMQQILNSKSELKFGEFNDDTYIDYSKYDLNALHEDTGFECKADFRESIIKTAEWVRSLNWDN